MDRRGFYVIVRFPRQALKAVKLLTGRHRPCSVHPFISRRNGNTELPLNCRRQSSEPFAVSSE
jgi:hypothetical protein